MDLRIGVWIAALVILSASRAQCDDAPKFDYDYCVIGAGPGGLQMASFLGTRAGDTSFVVFEREPEPGSFFATYPIHRTLISINKKFTGRTNPEYNLRHDWNSLLVPEELTATVRPFTNYTDAYYPSADIYVEYLRDYAKTAIPHGFVEYNTEVVAVRRAKGDLSDGFMVTVESRAVPGCSTDGVEGETIDCEVVQRTVSCNRVIIGVGADLPHTIDDAEGFELAIPYRDAPTEASAYRNKRVLIIGKRNAAFEVATVAAEQAAYVIMVSPTPIQLSYLTHYVGHVRAVNDVLLDHYQLKSQDVLLDEDIRRYHMIRCTDDDQQDAICLRHRSEPDLIDPTDPLTRHPFDVVVACTGMSSDLSFLRGSARPGMYGRGSRRPNVDMSPSYEATHVSGLFFVGAITHSIDYEQSSGGFIHGFRYTNRALFRLLRHRFHNEPWPSVTIDGGADPLVSYLLRRSNEASGLYQMFGQLADVAYSTGDGVWHYHEEIPVGLMYSNEFVASNGKQFYALVLTLDYGVNFHGCEVIGRTRVRAKGPEDADKSGFLHPVMRLVAVPPGGLARGQHPAVIYSHHVVEDVFVEWDHAARHVEPTVAFVKKAMQFARAYDNTIVYRK